MQENNENIQEYNEELVNKRFVSKDNFFYKKMPDGRVLSGKQLIDYLNEHSKKDIPIKKTI